MAAVSGFDVRQLEPPLHMGLLTLPHFLTSFRKNRIYEYNIPPLLRLPIKHGQKLPRIKFLAVFVLNVRKPNASRYSS